jgi:catechol 2,3-dioxygenase-like lactoylglutathione lyase family enzyme
MGIRMNSVVIDANHLDVLARFWSRLLGLEVTRRKDNSGELPSWAAQLWRAPAATRQDDATARPARRSSPAARYVPTGQASHTLTRQQPSFGLLSPHSSEGLQWTALAYAQRDDTT